MITTADRIQRVQKASRRGANFRGEDIIALSVGEPDFSSPQPVIDALVAAINDGWTHYTPGNGLAVLRERIAAMLNGRFGSELEADNILITHGGAAGITASALAYIGSGDVVVVPDPTYSLYNDAVALAGGTLVPVAIDMADQPQAAADLVAAVRANNAKMLMLCNPVNPTGAIFDRVGLQAIAEGLAGTDCLVLSDEAYQDFQYTDRYASALEIPELRERLLLCQTFSKSFAMTGWRIGYLAADTELLKPIALAHRTFTGSLNSAVQVAAVTAIETMNETVPPMLETYASRRALVMQLLAEIPGVTVSPPDAAFYIFIGYPFDVPATEMQRMLALDFGVGVRAGSEFGDHGEYQLRLSYAYDEETLTRGLERLRDAFIEMRDVLPLRSELADQLDVEAAQR